MMINKSDCINKLTTHLPYIQEEFKVSGLCIFGSFARGENKVDSDLDLFVDMPPKISLIAALKEYLENLLDVSIDLVRNHTHLSKRFLDSISHDIIRII